MIFRFLLCLFPALTNRKEQDIRKLLRFALGLPRGHAKLPSSKFWLSGWLFMTKAKFILIVCANAPLAELLLSDIHDILKSDNIQVVYGDWEGDFPQIPPTQRNLVFHDRSIILVARGWKGGIRGINLKHSRPDVIFLDDVQTKENSESETESKTLLSELIGTIFKALTPLGNKLIIYVGNMYSDHCILAQFKKKPRLDFYDHWSNSHRLQTTLAGTFSLWKLSWKVITMMKPWEWLMSGLQKSWMILRIQHKVFSRTHFRLPDSRTWFHSCNWRFYYNWPSRIPENFGRKCNRRASEVWKLRSDCRNCERNSRSRADNYSGSFLAIKWRCSLICIEDTGYQMTLAFWMNKYIVQYSLSDLVVLPVSPTAGTRNPASDFLSRIFMQRTIIHDPVTRRDFTWQASMYKVGKPNNRDDLLDACAYGQDVRNEYWQHISFLDHGITIEGTCRVIPNNTPFKETRMPQLSAKNSGTCASLLYWCPDRT